MNHAMGPLRQEHKPEYDVSNLSQYSYSELSRFKGNIEKELNSIIDELDSQNVTMDTSLLTHDGFPRLDIDVLQIRLQRIKVIQLKNDLKAIMDELANCLQVHLGSNKKEDDAAQKTRVPFLVVDDISEASIALQQLQIKDKIITFNELNATNYGTLQNVAKNIKSSNTVELTIERNTDIKKISISHERGPLGIKFTPL